MFQADDDFNYETESSSSSDTEGDNDFDCSSGFVNIFAFIYQSHQRNKKYEYSRHIPHQRGSSAHPFSGRLSAPLRIAQSGSSLMDSSSSGSSSPQVRYQSWKSLLDNRVISTDNRTKADSSSATPTMSFCTGELVQKTFRLSEKTDDPDFPRTWAEIGSLEHVFPSKEGELCDCLLPPSSELYDVADNVADEDGFILEE